MVSDKNPENDWTCDFILDFLRIHKSDSPWLKLADVITSEKRPLDFFKKTLTSICKLIDNKSKDLNSTDHADKSRRLSNEGTMSSIDSVSRKKRRISEVECSESLVEEQYFGEEVLILLLSNAALAIINFVFDKKFLLNYQRSWKQNDTIERKPWQLKFFLDSNDLSSHISVENCVNICKLIVGIIRIKVEKVLPEPHKIKRQIQFIVTTINKCLSNSPLDSKICLNYNMVNPILFYIVSNREKNIIEALYDKIFFIYHECFTKWSNNLVQIEKWCAETKNIVSLRAKIIYAFRLKFKKFSSTDILNFKEKYFDDNTGIEWDEPWDFEIENLRTSSDNKSVNSVDTVDTFRNSSETKIDLKNYESLLNEFCKAFNDTYINRFSSSEERWLALLHEYELSNIYNLNRELGYWIEFIPSIEKISGLFNSRMKSMKTGLQTLLNKSDNDNIPSDSKKNEFNDAQNDTNKSINSNTIFDKRNSSNQCADDVANNLLNKQKNDLKNKLIVTDPMIDYLFKMRAKAGEAENFEKFACFILGIHPADVNQVNLKKLRVKLQAFLHPDKFPVQHLTKEERTPILDKASNAFRLVTNCLEILKNMSVQQILQKMQPPIETPPYANDFGWRKINHQTKSPRKTRNSVRNERNEVYIVPSTICNQRNKIFSAKSAFNLAVRPSKKHTHATPANFSPTNIKTTFTELGNVVLEIKVSPNTKIDSSTKFYILHSWVLAPKMNKNNSNVRKRVIQHYQFKIPVKNVDQVHKLLFESIIPIGSDFEAFYEFMWAEEIDKDLMSHYFFSSCYIKIPSIRTWSNSALKLALVTILELSEVNGLYENELKNLKKDMPMNFLNAKKDNIRKFLEYSFKCINCV